MKGEAECEDGTIAGSWAAYPPPLALLELMMMEVTITISMISRPFYPLLPPHPPHQHHHHQRICLIRANDDDIKGDFYGDSEDQKGTDFDIEHRKEYERSMFCPIRKGFIIKCMAC